MKNNPLYLALIASVFLAACGGGDKPSGSRTVAISGKVISDEAIASMRVAASPNDPSVAPPPLAAAISNANVELRKVPATDDSPIYRTITDNDGYFSLEDVELGQYEVEIRSNTEEVRWVRALLHVSSAGDVGAFPISPAPYFERVVVNGNELPVPFGARQLDFTRIANAFEIGKVFTVVHEVIDPNNSPVSYSVRIRRPPSFLADDQTFFARKLEGSPVQRITWTFTLHDDHYLVDYDGFHQARFVPALVNEMHSSDLWGCFVNTYESCTQTPSFSWTDVSQLAITVGIDNSDTHLAHVWNDLEAWIKLTNSAYDYVPPPATYSQAAFRFHQRSGPRQPRP